MYVVCLISTVLTSSLFLIILKKIYITDGNQDIFLSIFQLNCNIKQIKIHPILSYGRQLLKSFTNSFLFIIHKYFHNIIVYSRLTSYIITFITVVFLVCVIVLFTVYTRSRLLRIRLSKNNNYNLTDYNRVQSNFIICFYINFNFMNTYMKYKRK